MQGSQRIRRTCIVVGCAAVAAAGAAPAAATPESTFVSASVATLWTGRSAPRPVDAPALRAQPNMVAWNRSLTTAERRGLVGRVATQALLGERVLVLKRRGGWAQVVVPDQPTQRDARGYPGWVPAAQLYHGPFLRNIVPYFVIVKRPTAVMVVGGTQMRLSYGTRLPATRVSAVSVDVTTPSHTLHGRIARDAVTVYRTGAKPPRPTGRALIRDARMFLGRPYLWGGTAAFGFDCSGLIQLLFRAHGATIPRDADAQARAGHAVSRSSLRPGDVLFYGRPRVTHAALYAGGGMMIEAPDSAHLVRVTPVRSRSYAGARRLTTVLGALPVFR